MRNNYIVLHRTVLQGSHELTVRSQMCRRSSPMNKLVFSNERNTDKNNENNTYIRGQGGQATAKMDVVGLLAGLIAIGVLLVIIGLLIYYLCQKRCKPRRLPGNPSCRRHNSSIIFQRHEELSLNPLSPRIEPIGLPTYEQAVALRGNYDVPPPPYPGPLGGIKVFKKSFSLPAP